MANPIDLPSLVKRLLKMERQLAQLLARRPDTGAHNADELDDIEVKYNHPTDAPAHGEALRWDTTRETRFGGLASFRGPTVEARFFEEPVTGAGSFGVGGPMVPGDWDVTRPCLVTVTAAFDGDYWPVEATSSPDPITFVRPPMMTLQILDTDTGRVTAPAAGFELVNSVWPVVEQYPGAASAHSVESRSWLFSRGLPTVGVGCEIDADAAPGLTGTARILAITRATRL